MSLSESQLALEPTDHDEDWVIPQTQEQGKKLIEEILIEHWRQAKGDEEGGFVTESKIHSKVLQVLKKYPLLAKENFTHPSCGSLPPILYMFVIGGASLDVVAAVYDMWPEALNYDFENDVGYMEAFYYSLDVPIELGFFLLKQKPELLVKGSFLTIDPYDESCHEIPNLCFFIKHGRSNRLGHDEGKFDTETLKKMMELYPLCHEKLQCDTTYGNLYKLAMECRSDPKLLDYLAENFPKSTKACNIGIDHEYSAGSALVDEPRARSLVKLLPRLSQFGVQGATWTNRGYISLMRGMTSAHQLDLKLEFPKYLFHNNRAALLALQEGLATICFESKIHISLGGRSEIRISRTADYCRKQLRYLNANIDDALAEAVITGILKSAVKELSLYSVPVQNIEPLFSFLAGEKSPNTLALYQCTLVGNDLAKSPTDWSRSRLNTFAWNKSTSSPKVFEHFCRSLSVVPDLRVVTIALRKSAEAITPYVRYRMTKVLGELFNNRKLAFFKGHRLEMNAGSIFNTLKWNQSVKTIILDSPSDVASPWSDDETIVTALRRLLEEDNTTIRHVRLPCSVPVGETSKIRYLTDLNRHGRRAARDPGTSLETLIDLLDHIRVKCDPALRAFQVQYGLLREQPGLWCSAAKVHQQPTKKRKREQD